MCGPKNAENVQIYSNSETNKTREVLKSGELALATKLQKNRTASAPELVFDTHSGLCSNNDKRTQLNPNRSISFEAGTNSLQTCAATNPGDMQSSTEVLDFPGQKQLPHAEAIPNVSQAMKQLMNHNCIIWWPVATSGINSMLLNHPVMGTACCTQ